MKKKTMILSTAILLTAAFGSHAQQYPTKSVRLIMPYPAGGSTDTIGRLIAERITATLGQTVIVDNRAGASAQIGTEIAAKAPADGYTLLMATSTNSINHVINPKLPYDFFREFQPVSLIVRAAQLLVVHPSLPARSVRELIALSKAQPGKLTYASSGSGTSGHLAMEAFSREAKIKIVHVPYKGNAPALSDLMGGHVVMGFANVVTVVPNVKAGLLRAVGISSAKRSTLVPDVPTIAESGMPGFDIAAWFGIMAPSGTPEVIVNRLGKEISAILNSAQVSERLTTMGVDRTDTQTPAAFAEFLKTDLKRWAKIIHEAGIK